MVETPFLVFPPVRPMFCKRVRRCYPFRWMARLASTAVLLRGPLCGVWAANVVVYRIRGTVRMNRGEGYT